jgi:predicted SAM-dependent methyltransferase
MSGSICNFTKARIKKMMRDWGIRFELLQEIRHELHLVGLRLRQRFWPRQRRKARRLRELSGVNLHFGCGDRILPEWVNLDAYACDGISMELDLQGELPLSDSSVRWIFTEHVLEHIDRSRIRSIFSEFHRVLAPGGVARILVPDLQFYCRAYLDGDVKAITTRLPHTHTTADAVNSVFNDHFHRFVYDFDTMRIELEGAGFRDVIQCNYGESQHHGLALDSDLESRRVGTLCVEATRNVSDQVRI